MLQTLNGTLLQTLNCSSTEVADLGPLSACTLLQDLDCGNTKVAELRPLAACTGLVNLTCPIGVTEARIQRICKACRNLDWVSQS